MTLPQSLLPHSNLFDTIRKVIPGRQNIYLVGGAVRDALIDKTTHDLDFVLTKDVQESSRNVANALNAAYYPLDEKRTTARVVIVTRDGDRQFLDFAQQRGDTIEDDLRARDFTINAMAIPLSEEIQMIDPLGGAADLIERKLRVCSENSIIDDPIRILRAIRQAVSFQLSIVPETKNLLTKSADKLSWVSPERVRDEIFRIFEGTNPAGAMKILGILGIQDYMLPEISKLKEVAQSPPHNENVYLHSIRVVEKLDEIINLISLKHNPARVNNWASGYLSVRLGRFKKQLQSHFSVQLNPDRSHKSLMLFASLYHDSGKYKTRMMTEKGKIRFYTHEIAGAEIIGKRARELKLSNVEIEWLYTVIKNHLRPLHLTNEGKIPTRRAVYRFFRDCGEAGVDVCLLSLADMLTLYGPNLTNDLWIDHVKTVDHMLDSWWEKKSEYISPEKIITGNDLITKFNLNSGPVIGKLLSEINEAQAVGEIKDKDDAFIFANNWLKENYG